MTQHLKRQLPFIFITLLFITVAFLDRLLPEGMFSDGLLYAALGRNMAIGKGSFWMPYFGHGSYFWEHPPLMMGLESIFFRLLGDHYSTEKVYCAVVWGVNVWMIRKLWLVEATPGRRAMYWLPLLMWSTSATVLWTYPNNALECTMTIFDITAAIFIYKGCAQEGNRAAHLAWGGLFIILASLTKGPVGLFPLAIPAIYYIAFRKGSLGVAVWRCVYLLLVVVAGYLLLTLFDAPRYMLANYLDQQLLSSLAGKREQVESSLGRLNIFMLLVMQLSPAAILALLLFAAAKLLRLKATDGPQKRLAIFFLLTGLSASLPIIISIKQSSFYLVPSIPFYVCGLALLAYPYVAALTHRYTLPVQASRIFRVAVVAAAVGCVFYLWPKAYVIGRDEELIHDIKLISATVPRGDTLGTCPAMEYEFTFRAYAERYGQLEVKQVRRRVYPYIIVEKNICGSAYTDSLATRGFAKQQLPTMKYDLYRASYVSAAN